MKQQQTGRIACKTVRYYEHVIKVWRHHISTQC